MILKFIMGPLWVLLDLIVTLIPDNLDANTYKTLTDSSIFNLLGKGAWFIGVDNFVRLIGAFLFWQVAHFGWAVIEWIYKKIPGVD